MSRDTVETYIVDSFTDEPFKGNPAGVCVLENELDNDQMLTIAQELNLSETAYIKKSDADDSYTIRFFSPKMEIPLCGHATLAASKVVFEKFQLEEVHFKNTQGLDLYVQKKGSEILMEFPSYNTTPANAPTQLLKALGLNSIVNSEYNEETEILLLEIEDDRLLRRLEPDYAALFQSHDGINGVLVTAPSSNTDYDFQSRYFWPWSGTNEDPVTGGTHTFLTGYWSKRLKKVKMRSFQCSKRSGFMEVELISENAITIKSQAVLVFEGKLNL